MDKKSGATFVITQGIDPEGNAVHLVPFVTVKGAKATLSMDLPIGGTWIIAIAGTAGAGGTLSYAFKVKQPRSAAFEAD